MRWYDTYIQTFAHIHWTPRLVEIGHANHLNKSLFQGPNTASWFSCLPSVFSLHVCLWSEKNIRGLLKKHGFHFFFQPDDAHIYSLRRCSEKSSMTFISLVHWTQATLTHADTVWAVCNVSVLVFRNCIFITHSNDLCYSNFHKNNCLCGVH